MQVLEIITDASLAPAAITPSQGIGAIIARFSDRRRDSLSNKVQILRGCILFKAEQSFEAEIITGINGFLESLKRLSELNIELSPSFSVKWFCDLPYLPKLLINPESASNKTLKKLLEDLNQVTKDYTFEVCYPNRSSELRYHDYCHRICSELRQHFLTSEESNCSHDSLCKRLKSFPSWSFLLCKFCTQRDPSPKSHS